MSTKSNNTSTNEVQPNDVTTNITSTNEIKTNDENTNNTSTNEVQKNDVTTNITSTNTVHANKATTTNTSTPETKTNIMKTNTNSTKDIRTPDMTTKTTSMNDNISPTTSIDSTSMERRQLHSSQQEALKKINDFSGESNDLDVDEWLFDLTNLFSLMKLTDETKILLTMGKLNGLALRWYQEHLTSFCDWQEAEDALRDRFQTFTSDGQLVQEFFQLRQEEDQSIAAFYDMVIRKYRKSRGLITAKQIITVLQAGVKNSLKAQLIRNEVNMGRHEEWLILAREEEQVQRRIQQRHTPPRSTTNQPYFESTLPSATIQQQPSNHQPKHRTYNQNHRYTSPPADGNYQARRTYGRNPNHTQQRPTDRRTIPQPSKPCLICNRTNHSTMQCFYKKNEGCFRCGQSNHQIRDCPQHHFFE